MKLVRFQQTDSRLIIELDISDEGIEEVTGVAFTPYDSELENIAGDEGAAAAWTFHIWGDLQAVREK